MRRLRSAKLIFALAVTLLTFCTGSAAHASPLSLANTQPTVVLQQQARGQSSKLATGRVVPRAQRRSKKERISDDAGLLSSNSRAKLTEQILAIESRTESEVVLVTLPTIGGPGKDVKQYATDLFNRWDIGQEAGERKKGVLILFVKDGGAHRKGRIQVAVSRSLNSAVSKTWTDEMVETYVLPWLRRQDYGVGFEKCIERLEPRLNRNGGDDLREAIPYAGVLALYGSGLYGTHLYQDRRSRTCDSCGSICEKDLCGDWKTDIEATDRQAGMRRREIKCHKCGSVSVKEKVIRKYDGRRRDGTYYYFSSDGGGSDGGGGGGGDC